MSCVCWRKRHSVGLPLEWRLIRFPNVEYIPMVAYNKVTCADALLYFHMLQTSINGNLQSSLCFFCVKSPIIIRTLLWSITLVTLCLANVKITYNCLIWDKTLTNFDGGSTYPQNSIMCSLRLTWSTFRYVPLWSHLWIILWRVLMSGLPPIP